MDTGDQVKRFEEFLEDNYKTEILDSSRKGREFINIDFKKLAKFDPELAELLLEEPEEVIAASELAIKQFDVKKKFNVRFKNLPSSQTILIRDIRSKNLNNLYCIEGIVRQKSDVRPQVTAAKFECPSCGNIINVLQVEQKFKEPSRCGCGRKGKFRLISKELIDAQGITLEEAPEDLDGGEQPKRMKIFLKDDLVSPISDRHTNPGSKILVNGIIKETPLTGRDGSKLTRFDLLIEANYVQAIQEDFSDVKISKEDEAEIKKIASDPKVYEKVAQSMAPSIFGHDKIKESLVLQLVGGVKKERKDGVTTRGDMHVLLIGDPGSGKSQLLKRTSKIAPKSRYVSGKGVSGAGLTASVVKDEFLGGWALEAGALPLSNRGFCLTEDTEILLNDGKIKKIKDIYERKRANILSYDFKKQKTISTKIKNISKRKSDDLYLIEFVDGESLKITGEHPLPVWDNGILWKEVNQLKEGQHLFNTLKYDFKEEGISKKNLDLAYLLGLILTGGHISKKKHTVRFYTKSDEIKEKYIHLIKKLFNKKCGVYVDKRSNVNQIYFCSKEICEKLSKMGIKRGNKSLQDISLENFLNLTTKEIRYFLTGVINGDGSISNRKFGGCVDIVCKNKKVGIYYRKMFRKIGVISSLNSLNHKGGGVVKKGNYTINKLTITGISNIKKIDNLYLTKKKKEKLDAILKRQDKSWKIPKINKIISDLSDKIPFGERKKLYKYSIKKSLLNRGFCLTREKLGQLILNTADLNPLNKTSEFKQLNNIYKNENYFPKIKNINKIKGGEVYNLQIDMKNDPNFFANFQIVHNCMIDEMDKMSAEDTAAMHEALEGQTITISKANIQATLRSETTVLAAANPKFGRFDPYDVLAKQINMPPTLINRFDLIFPVKDLPDEKKDDRLAKHILTLHKDPNIIEGEIDSELLRKFISYARTRCKPKLTDAALNEIRKYYVDMRNQGNEEAGLKAVPISARQLEGLVRLAEASAKIRLDTKVTKKDAKRAIELVHYCLSQVGLDPETGKIDIDRIATGVTTSQRSKIVGVKEVIMELENKIGKTIPIDDVLKECESRNIDESDVEEALEKLKRSGDIFEPKHGFISRI